MTADDERQLITRARGGDNGACRALVERHIRGAYDLAMGFVSDHDAAEDVVQEAFVRAFAGLGDFRGDSRFATWLHRIVVNLSLNTVKRRRVAEERTAPRVEAVPAEEIDGALHSADMRAHIERALHDLPPFQRAAVTLRHMEGMSTRDVSRILQCSEGTVKTHVFRGLEKLRKKLSYLKDE